MQKRITKKLPAIAAALLIAACMTGCASDSKIRSDFDRNADFSQYQTYNFYADAGPDGTNYQSLFSQHMVTAITKEMDARGYEKSDDPDLLVNFNAFLRDKTKVTTRPAPVSYGDTMAIDTAITTPGSGIATVTLPKRTSASTPRVL